MSITPCMSTFCIGLFRHQKGQNGHQLKVYLHCFTQRIAYVFTERSVYVSVRFKIVEIELF